MSSWKFDWDYCVHERTDPDHVVDYVDTETGLVYFKDGCIEDWG